MRTRLGWVLALAVPPALGAALGAGSSELLAVGSLALLANAVLCALVGGRWPAVAGAVAGSLSLNWFLTRPHRTLWIADSAGAVSLLLFLVVAIAVSSVVDSAARSRARAAQAQRGADDLTELNRALMRGDDDPRHLLTLLQERFDRDAVSLLRRTDGWEIVSSVGEHAPATPEDATDVAALSPTLAVAARGSAPLPDHQADVLAAFAVHLAAALERQELRREAAEVERLREGNQVRTAILAALSHDLRTPLASIKATVSGLRDDTVRWSAEDQRELLRSVEDSTDRLHVILENLLDLGRLQAGAVRPGAQEVGLDDVVNSTLSHLPRGDEVQLDFAEHLPPVRADGGLLERVVANLVDNAQRHSPDGSPVTVRTIGDDTVGADGRVELHVVDHGPGVPEAQKGRIFLPFQRLGDVPTGEGVGLGLAVARGLVEAMGGRLDARDTPGGGLTMVVALPAVAP